MPILLYLSEFFKTFRSNLGMEKISENIRKFQIYKKIVIYAGMTRNFFLMSKTILFNIKLAKKNFPRIF